MMRLMRAELWLLVLAILVAGGVTAAYATECDPPPEGFGPCEAGELYWRDPPHDPVCVTVGDWLGVGYQFQPDDDDYCENGWPGPDDVVCTWSGVPGTDQGTSWDHNWFFWVSWFYTDPFTECGVYYLTATINDVADCSATDDEPKSRIDTIYVKPALPECADDPTPTTGCDSGGGGCGTCGSDGPPSPDIKKPIIALDPGPGGGPGAGENGSDTGGCNRERMKVVDTCSGLYAMAWDKCGKCGRIGPLTIPSSGDPVAFGPYTIGSATVTGTVSVGGGTTYTLTYPDGSTSHYSFGLPGASTGFAVSSGPNDMIGPDGTTATTFNRNAVTNALESVQMPNGDTWTYGHEQGGTKITSITAPDGTYTEVAYVQSGNGVGKLGSVTVYTDSSKTTQVSQTSYGYDTNNKLSEFSKGNRTVTYTYSEGGQVITVKDMDGQTVMTETVYDYREPATDPDNDSSTHTTTVIRKDPNDPNKDQTTYYCFYIDANNNKTYVRRIIDPLGKMTEYTVDSAGVVTSVEDASGLTTSYSYNSKEAVTQVTHASSAGTFYEDNTYYTSGGNDTVWLKTQESRHPYGLHGDFTYYVRSANSLWQVDAMKVSGPISGNPPSQQDWDNIDPIKEYTYYGSSDPDGLPGQLKTEVVRDIDGTEDHVVEYKYTEVVNQVTKRRNSPTETIYKYWNGSSYITRTSYTHYDDMGQVLSTTDAGSREIDYTYDTLNRLLKTIYGTGVETENHYGCCTLEWAADEEDRTTHYAYDDMNRLTKTWTGITGQSETYPLVAYAYDAFGNQQTVTTRSDTNATRDTKYTYDLNNRVTKIVYPYSQTEEDLLGNEEFGYDDVGSLIWKKDGNGDVTLYRYDELHRLTNVYYDYTGSLTPPSYTGLISRVTYEYTVNQVDYGSSLKTSMKEYDASGTLLRTNSYSYDIQSRLKTYTPPVGLSEGYYVEYDYNALGQKKYVKITNGTTTPYNIGYDYFANGWLKAVKSGANTIASYSYDDVGNRTRVDYGNGTYTLYTYDSDPRYRISSIEHYRVGSPDVLLAEIGYSSRDDVGNSLSIEDWIGEWTYGYDANNRLDSATPPSGPIPDQPAGGDYGYDWVGNRLNPPSGGNHMVYKGRIRSALIDSEKRLHQARGNARAIIEAADRIEEEALARIRSIRRKLARKAGPDREILEAEYLAALDEKRKAGQAGMMARRTAVKLGG